MKKDTNPSILDDLKTIEDSNRSDLSRVVDILLNDSFHRRKTRLGKNLIASISLVDTLAQIWDIEFFKAFLPTYTQYLTSLDGKGRQEIVDITKYSIDKETQYRNEMMQTLGKR